MNGSSSRVTGEMQGLEPQDYDMTNDDYDAYVFAYQYGDATAQMQGLKDWRKKRKAKKEARKAKRAARQAMREGRRGMRMRRKEARTLRSESGDTFFGRVGGALRDMGQGKLSEFEGMELFADEGIDLDPTMFRDMAQDFGGDVMADGLKKSGIAPAEWWAANKKWALPVAIGVPVVIAGLIFATRKKKGRRR
jgi:hypothetical protein